MEISKGYDINRRKHIDNPTVEQVIEELQKLPKDSRVSVCGSDTVYFHFAKDDSLICLDTDSLYDDYWYQSINEVKERKV